MANKDENIDQFVKKVISHYDVKYDEAHWQAMEARLDSEMPVIVGGGAPINVPSVIVSVLGGMVLMLGILWTMGTFDEQEIVSQNATESGSEENRYLELSSQNQKKEIIGEGQLKSNLEGSNKTDNSLGDLKSVDSDIANKDLIQDRESETDAFNTNFVADKLNNSSNDESMKLMDRRGEEVLVIDVGSRSYHHDLPGSAEDFVMVAYPSDSSGDFSEIISDKATQGIVPDKKKRFQFGATIGVAPDFNGVGMMHSDKTLSGQVGVQLFATYLKRISLTSGVFFGKKKYTAQGAEYSPPNNYWIRKTNGVVPMEVIGTSVVIDVPINLSYNWNPGRRLQFLSSVGVSSYYILSEDCWYKFQSNNPGAEGGWETDQMVKNAFGVGNISLGMLWYIKPRLGLKIEPYLKVPFKDFGWGKINLYGAGSLISVQYTFY
ncbi:MAG: hypothetical protein ACFHWX_10065 [Bacteroidota bacterium]